jgi:hypothetical protein
MSAMTLLASAPPATAGGAAMGVWRICDRPLPQPLVITNHAVAQRMGSRLDRDVNAAARRDDASVSGMPPSVCTKPTDRAVIAAGHEFAWLSAALAFFRSKPSVDAIGSQIGRLRV